MLKDILCYKADSLWSHHCLFTIDIPYHLVINIFFYIHCLDVIYTEWKYIFIIDGIYDGICMKLITKGLTSGKELRVFCTICIHREYRCTRKSKQMIFLEVLYDGCVHITKLTSVTFIKDNNHMFLIYFMPRILFDEGSKLLNRCDNDSGIRIL